MDAGFTSGVWTGPMIGRLIQDKWASATTITTFPGSSTSSGSPSSDPVSDSLGPTSRRRRPGCARAPPEIKASACRGRSFFEDRPASGWTYPPPGSGHDVAYSPGLIPMASKDSPRLRVRSRSKGAAVLPTSSRTSSTYTFLSSSSFLVEHHRGRKVFPGHRQRLPLARRAGKGVAREQRGYARAPPPAAITHPSSTHGGSGRPQSASPRTTGSSTPPTNAMTRSEGPSAPSATAPPSSRGRSLDSCRMIDRPREPV